MIFDGIFPFSLGILFLFQGTFELTLVNIVATIGNIVFTLAIMITAFLTWKGNDRARLWFLILISAYNALLIGNTLYVMSYTPVPEDMSQTIYGRMIRAVLFPIVYWIYFSRHSVRRFFDNTPKATQ
jgi:H+/Cl- antiporter ClcA